jgi:hypothetical protein
MRESVDADAGSLYSAASDDTRAAKPEAEEASPAAVGKLLCEQMCTLKPEIWMMGGRESVQVPCSRECHSLADLGETGLAILKLLPHTLHLRDARREAAAVLDLIFLPIEPEPVLLERGVGTRRRRRAQVVLVECHGQ